MLGDPIAGLGPTPAAATVEAKAGDAPRAVVPSAPSAPSAASAASDGAAGAAPAEGDAYDEYEARRKEFGSVRRGTYFGLYKQEDATTRRDAYRSNSTVGLAEDPDATAAAAANAAGKQRAKRRKEGRGRFARGSDVKPWGAGRRRRRPGQPEETKQGPEGEAFAGAAGAQDQPKPKKKKKPIKRRRPAKKPKCASARDVEAAAALAAQRDAKTEEIARQSNECFALGRVYNRVSTGVKDKQRLVYKMTKELRDERCRMQDQPDALEARFEAATRDREARLLVLVDEADVAERYGKQLAHVEVRTRRGLNRVDALNNRLKDALARVRVEMRVATQQGMANEEAAKQAAAKLARVAHATSELAAEHNNALRYRRSLVQESQRLTKDAQASRQRRQRLLESIENEKKMKSMRNRAASYTRKRAASIMFVAREKRLKQAEKAARRLVVRTGTDEDDIGDFYKKYFRAMTSLKQLTESSARLEKKRDALHEEFSKVSTGLYRIQVVGAEESHERKLVDDASERVRRSERRFAVARANCARSWKLLRHAELGARNLLYRVLADKHGLVRHDVMNSLVATGSDAALGLKFDPVKTIAKVVARLMEIINVVVVTSARRQRQLNRAHGAHGAGGARGSVHGAGGGRGSLAGGGRHGHRGSQHAAAADGGDGDGGDDDDESPRTAREKMDEQYLKESARRANELAGGGDGAEGGAGAGRSFGAKLLGEAGAQRSASMHDVGAAPRKESAHARSSSVHHHTQSTTWNPNNNASTARMVDQFNHLRKKFFRKKIPKVNRAKIFVAPPEKPVDAREITMLDKQTWSLFVASTARKVRTRAIAKGVPSGRALAVPPAGQSPDGGAGKGKKQKKKTKKSIHKGKAKKGLKNVLVGKAGKKGKLRLGKVEAEALAKKNYERIYGHRESVFGIGAEGQGGMTAESLYQAALAYAFEGTDESAAAAKGAKGAAAAKGGPGAKGGDTLTVEEIQQRIEQFNETRKAEEALSTEEEVTLQKMFSTVEGIFQYGGDEGGGGGGGSDDGEEQETKETKEDAATKKRLAEQAKADLKKKVDKESSRYATTDANLLSDGRRFKESDMERLQRIQADEFAEEELERMKEQRARDADAQLDDKQLAEKHAEERAARHQRDADDDFRSARAACKMISHELVKESAALIRYRAQHEEDLWHVGDGEGDASLGGSARERRGGGGGGGGANKKKRKAQLDQNKVGKGSRMQMKFDAHVEKVVGLQVMLDIGMEGGFSELSDIRERMDADKAKEGPSWKARAVEEEMEKTGHTPHKPRGKKRRASVAYGGGGGKYGAKEVSRHDRLRKVQSAYPSVRTGGGKSRKKGGKKGKKKGSSKKKKKGGKGKPAVSARFTKKW